MIRHKKRVEGDTRGAEFANDATVPSGVDIWQLQQHNDMLFRICTSEVTVGILLLS